MFLIVDDDQWYNLRPDTLAEYRAGQQHLLFWLEWDRGTMNMRDLAIKFTSYAYYIASRVWAREYSLLPMLICIAPDIAQERLMQRVTQARLAHAPWICAVDNDGSVVTRTGTACSYMVAEYATAQSSVTAGVFAQAMLV